MTTETSYTTASGRIYEINEGLSRGKTWGTYERKPNGALRRIVSPRLPLRATREEALEDFWVWIGQRSLGDGKSRDEVAPIYWRHIQEVQASWPPEMRSLIPETYRIPNAERTNR